MRDHKMEVDKRQYLQDNMNDRRSFGSLCHPSSQSRKISIGVMVDPFPKKKSGASKETVVNSKAENPEEYNPGDAKKKGKAVIDANGTLDQVNSPPVVSRSFRQSQPIPGEGKKKGKAVMDANGALDQVNNPPMATRSFHQSERTSKIVLEANKNTNLDSGNKNQKVPVGTRKRNEDKDQNLERVEDVATSQQAFVSDKVKKNATTENGGTETLRMKLFEILGTVTSPKSQPSPAFDVANEMLQKPVAQKNNPVTKPIQKPENTESPARTMRRPVTRSLAGKKTSTREKPEKARLPNGNTFQAKNIFSFEDRLFSEGKNPANGSSSTSTKKGGLFSKGKNLGNGRLSTSTKKKNKRKNSAFVQHKIKVTENNSADEIEGTTNGSEASPRTAKTASLDTNSGVFYWSKREKSEKYNHQENDFHDSPINDPHLSQETSRTGKTEKNERKEGQKRDPDSKMRGRDQTRDSAHSPVSDTHLSQGMNGTHQPENLSSPHVPETECHVENFDSPSPRKAADSEHDYRSPTFKINSPIFTPWQSITPNTDEIKQVLHSHKVVDKRSSMQNNFIFKDYVPDAGTQSSDAEPDLKYYQQSGASPSNGKKDSDGLSKSSSSSEEYESSDEDSPVIKDQKKRVAFSAKPTAGKSKFALHQSRQSTRLHEHEAKRVSKFNPMPPSPKATRENDWTPEPTEQTQGDDLERILTLFASAVGNFANKMKLTARKKSSEILNSVSDEICSQLLKIESQIQTDLGKLTSASKSKRKRLETGLQEQQEQLQLLHHKFKQDVETHLQECKTTLEGIQLHQNEFKGAIKKQKASHQKLLVQVEEAIEAQLNDADRRITDAHKMARKKMVQLKHVIAQCLTEDVLS